MISIQRLLGRPREFFGLLESSASLSIQSIAELMARRTSPPSATPAARARRS
jgi:hypothetical protein